MAGHQNRSLFAGVGDCVGAAPVEALTCSTAGNTMCGAGRTSRGFSSRSISVRPACSSGAVETFMVHLNDCGEEWAQPVSAAEYAQARLASVA
jgi:hypothetical protein